jgi:hypothetical protein
MQHLRELKLSTAVLTAVAVAAASAALAGDLKAAAPKNVNLTAIWKINPELSDDPQKVLAKKREESAGGGPMGGGGGGGTSGGSTRVGKADVDMGGIFGGVISGTMGTGRRGGGGSSDRPETDPAPSESMRVPLDSFLATREQFEIQQLPDALTISTYDETTTCKPGVADKVPVQSGEMVDRHCGWDGGTFVVELVDADGVKRVNRYDLRKGDRQLVLTSQIKGGKGQLRGLQLKRVYDRAVAF